jgi:hypothetical protein
VPLAAPNQFVALDNDWIDTVALTGAPAVDVATQKES